MKYSLDTSMEEIYKTQALKEWLESVNCFDVRPVVVEINGEKWEHCCLYKQKLKGETKARQMLYVIGKLPKVKIKSIKRGAFGAPDKLITNENVCFPYNNQDWYVACYINEIKEEYKQSHPFGQNFILAPWDIPNETIDKYEENPYSRYEMILS